MGATIMVVDDSRLVQHQVGRALREAGYEVLEATDGRDALDKLGVHHGIALVVCDVNMPRMNGIEFLEATYRRPTPPVVMVTTEGLPEMARRARALGAKGFLSKPFKMEELVDMVTQLAPPG